MKSLAVIAALVLASAGCSHRNGNLQVRYTGVVMVVGGALMITEPAFNGDGLDAKLSGGGAVLAAIGAGMVIGSLLVHPVDRVDREALRQREITLEADKLLHQAEAAAGKDDCATVDRLAPALDQLDPGVGAVLHSNVAAARCLAAREKLPMSMWLRRM